MGPQQLFDIDLLWPLIVVFGNPFPFAIQACFWVMRGAVFALRKISSEHNCQLVLDFLRSNCIFEFAKSPFNHGNTCAVANMHRALAITGTWSCHRLWFFDVLTQATFAWVVRRVTNTEGNEPTFSQLLAETRPQVPQPADSHHSKHPSPQKGLDLCLP
jgi:hypothetical protein